MKTRSTLLAASLIAMALMLVFAAVVSAAGAPLPGVYGGVAVSTEELESFTSFSAQATGPAPGIGEHQPARGFLNYSNEAGLTFTVSVEHIHTHSASEVHFGGTIVQSSDSSLVGDFAHAVAVDGGSPGTNGDKFSIITTDTDVHDHGTPVPVTYGNLVVKTL